MKRMEYNIRNCAQCNAEFIPKAHNGIYCSIDCRKIVTNANVLAKYYENKAILSGDTQRLCKRKNCSTILSRYNKEDLCEAHKIDRYIKRLSKWGWDEAALRKEYE